MLMDVRSCENLLPVLVQTVRKTMIGALQPFMHRFMNRMLAAD